MPFSADDLRRISEESKINQQKEAEARKIQAEKDHVEKLLKESKAKVVEAAQQGQCSVVFFTSYSTSSQAESSKVEFEGGSGDCDERKVFLFLTKEIPGLKFRIVTSSGLRMGENQDGYNVTKNLEAYWCVTEKEIKEQEEKDRRERLEAERIRNGICLRCKKKLSFRDRLAKKTMHDWGDCQWVAD